MDINKMLSWAASCFVCLGYFPLGQFPRINQMASKAVLKLEKECFDSEVWLGGYHGCWLTIFFKFSVELSLA